MRDVWGLLTLRRSDHGLDAQKMIKTFDTGKTIPSEGLT